MFIGVLDLFKIGIGPSSSHTMGPLVAAEKFRSEISKLLSAGFYFKDALQLQCTLHGSLGCTGKGHCSDQAVLLGLHGYTAEELTSLGVHNTLQKLSALDGLLFDDGPLIPFSIEKNIHFKCHESLPEHPNGMTFSLATPDGELYLEKVWFSIGGGFIQTRDEISSLKAPLKMSSDTIPFGFDSADSMLDMAEENQLSIAEMKRQNELAFMPKDELQSGLDSIWQAMKQCVEKGLSTTGLLPGDLNLQRRAASLMQNMQFESFPSELTDLLCSFAMAVSEENAAGHAVVTAPTNGAAGVIPAILYYLVRHEHLQEEKIRQFLLTAAAIGGLIKHRSSISGAEVGCQGEIGSASAMAAAGLCAVKGGTPQQVENAAEMALEHHLGLTCDPVSGLVQVPCIERNGFGAVKAWTAASLALKGTGQHFISLDKCIQAMKETGLDMSSKYKETSLGGLASNYTLC